MGLIDLKTNLKSLKYGKDRIGGGNSGQPFVQTPIPDSFSDVGNTGGEDFLVRGGSLIPSSVTNDVSRISKFLSSTEGLLFAAKNNTLIKTSPVYLPNNIAPKQVYNPSNTLAEVAGVASGLHLNFLGYTGAALDFQKYENQYSKQYNEYNTNRLTVLYQTKIGSLKPLNLVKDLASPDKKIQEQARQQLKAIKDYNIGKQFTDIIGNRDRVIDTRLTTSQIVSQKTTSTNFATYTSDQLVNNQSAVKAGTAGESTSLSSIKDFRQDLQTGNKFESVKFESFLAKSNYKDFNLERTYKIGNPGSRDILRSDYNYTTDKAIDKVNAKVIYKSSNIDQDVENSDIINFYFQAIDNDNPSEYQWIHFRAFLETIDDSFNGVWNDYTYTGRGEKFYTYSNFSRGVRMGFKVFTQTKAEQKPIYQKLNFLASLLAPDYSENGLMRGNLIKLTVGDYLNAVPGFISDLTYNIDQNTVWDIARGPEGQPLDGSLVLPHVISVNLSFTPVHGFTPRKSTNFETSFVGNVEDKVTAPFITLGNQSQGYSN